MNETMESKQLEPFRFSSRLSLTGLTGLKAANLQELADLIRTVPDSSIYHHTHRFLQQHQFLSPEPPNDFAYWVEEVMGEPKLGEKLASIDTVQFGSLRELRERIIKVINDYIEKNASSKKRFASDGQEFYFMKSVSFILPTRYEAHNLKEFAEILQKITIDSIYFHIFEARLRLQKEENDFSLWIEHTLGDKELADQLAQMDPYTRTLEDLRQLMIQLIERRIKE